MQQDQPIATASIWIAKPQEKVWEAVTEPAIVKIYFFNTDLVTDWHVGRPIYFRGMWEGKPYEDKGIVTVFDPMHTLSYTYKSSWDMSEDVPENYLLVTYILKEKETGTELTIIQTAKTEEQAKHSEQNWIQLLTEIKKLLEQ